DEQRAAGPAPSESRRARVDEEIERILREERTRAEGLLRDNTTLHETLVTLLLEKKVTSVSCSVVLSRKSPSARVRSSRKMRSISSSTRARRLSLGAGPAARCSS